MRKYSLFIFIAALVFLTTACEKDFLDQRPLDQVSVKDYFKSTLDLQTYVNQFYAYDLWPITGTRGLWCWESYYPGDNLIIADYQNETLLGVRTVPSDGGWDYSGVRNINYFFDNYRRCEDDFEEYKQYVGEAHFFRALIYYQLLKEWGDLPWYGTVLKTNSEDLYAARDPRNEVADKIIADLDTASLYLSGDRLEDGTRVNKWYALGLQSRVALYEGSWEKYHAGDPFGVSNADPEKYFRKVIEAAEKVMNSGIKLYSTGHPDRDYYDLFSQEDYGSINSVLFWRKYSVELGYSNTYNAWGSRPHGLGVTKGLADSYLCTDGKSISVSPLFGGYDTITNEMKNRDPRFEQTIFTPDAPWKIESNGEVITWGEGVWPKLNANTSYSCPTGYIHRKGYNAKEEASNLGGESTPMLLFRYAEVLLNFAEAKAELGTINQADIDKSINLLRDRVGMIHLDLSDIPEDPNWDFPDLSPIINEIRRERRIELSFEGIRGDDIFRWAAADELIIGKRPKGIFAKQLVRNPYPEDANGFLDPFLNVIPNGWGFDPNRDYLSPLSQKELTLNPNLKQNPGW